MPRFVFHCVTLILLVFGQCHDVPEATAKELPKNLEVTAKRYLSASSSYRSGDLITASQLEELQSYLRKTQGNSLATQSLWRRRMLPDQAPLVRSFHSGGAAVLRKAAKELGSYALLDKLSRSGNGRAQLERAIKLNSPSELIQSLKLQQAKLSDEMSGNAKKNAKKSTIKRIYTIDEFLTALSKQQAAATSVGSQVAQTSKKTGS